MTSKIRLHQRWWNDNESERCLFVAIYTLPAAWHWWCRLPYACLGSDNLIFTAGIALQVKEEDVLDNTKLTHLSLQDKQLLWALLVKRLRPWLHYHLSCRPVVWCLDLTVVSLHLEPEFSPAPAKTIALLLCDRLHQINYRDETIHCQGRLKLVIATTFGAFICFYFLEAFKIGFQRRMEHFNRATNEYRIPYSPIR